MCGWGQGSSGKCLPSRQEAQNQHQYHKKNKKPTNQNDVEADVKHTFASQQFRDQRLGGDFTGNSQ
jgi:hypothetical protein